MGELPVATRVDLARDEVAADGLERRGPATPAELVALAQGLEPLVVAHGMTVVLAHVAAQVHAQAGQVEAVRAPVIVDGQVADRTRGQLGVGSWGVPVWEPAASAEGGVVPDGGRAALKTADGDHAANTPSRMARRMAVSTMGSAAVRPTSQPSGVYTPAGRRATRVCAGRAEAGDGLGQGRFEEVGRVEPDGFPAQDGLQGRTKAIELRTPDGDDDLVGRFRGRVEAIRVVTGRRTEHEWALGVDAQDAATCSVERGPHALDDPFWNGVTGARPASPQRRVPTIPHPSGPGRQDCWATPAVRTAP